MAKQEPAGLSLLPLNHKPLNKPQEGRRTRGGRGAGSREQGKGWSAREKVLSCYLTFREQGKAGQAPALVNHEGLLAVGDGLLVHLLCPLPRVGAGPLAVAGGVAG